MLSPWLRRLLRLSVVYQVGALVVATALLWSVANTLLLRPAGRRAQELREQASAVEREVALLRAEVDQREPITRKERELFMQIDARLAERFPPETALPRALEAVARLARAKGATIELIRLETMPASGEPAAGGVPSGAVAAELPVGRKLTPHRVALHLRLVHDYRSGIEVLDGLGTLPVLLAVKSLEMQRVGHRVATDLTLIGFRLDG